MQVRWNVRLGVNRKVGWSSATGRRAARLPTGFAARCRPRRAGPSDLIVSNYGCADNRKKNHHFHHGQARSKPTGEQIHSDGLLREA
jgi:hypothetical protein